MSMPKHAYGDLGASVAMIDGANGLSSGVGALAVTVGTPEQEGFAPATHPPIDFNRIVSIAQVYDYAIAGWNESIKRRAQSTLGPGLWNAAALAYKKAAEHARRRQSLETGKKLLAEANAAADQARLADSGVGKVTASAKKSAWPWVVGALGVVGVGAAIYYASKEDD